MPPIPCLPPCALHAAGVQLSARIPRLLVAAIIDYPVPGSTRSAAGLHAVAVRSTPPGDRMDSVVVDDVPVLASGARHVAHQNRERRVEVDVALEAGVVQVSVDWHECTDFSRQVAKGSPTCNELLAMIPGSTGAFFLYSSDEWVHLQASILETCGNLDGILARRQYLRACVGPAVGLVYKALKKKHKSGKGAGDVCGEVTDAPALFDLCVRAARGCSAPELGEKALSLRDTGDSSCDSWRGLVDELSTLVGNMPELSPSIPAAVDSWCIAIRAADYESFAKHVRRIDAHSDVPCPLQLWLARLSAAGFSACLKEYTSSPVPFLQDERLVETLPEDLRSQLPCGSEIVLVLQTGSFMYDLHVESSDCDYRVLFRTKPEQALSVHPPCDEFRHHVNLGFGVDKSGLDEFKGTELGAFVLDLARGNPVNVELLFAQKAGACSSVWEELRAARTCFLTIRCCRQYLGFVADRLKKFEAIVGAHTFGGLQSAQASKLLYQTQHKFLDLRRVLSGDVPQVAVAGKEREKILAVRRSRLSLAEAKVLLEAAKSDAESLRAQLDEAVAAGRLPAEVDSVALLAWLRSVRERSILEVL